MPSPLKLAALVHRMMARCDVCRFIDVYRSMLARRMRIDVLDRDKNSIRGDEACGWAYANLDLVAEGQITEQWLQLRGVPSGEIRIRLLVLSGTDDSNEVRQILLVA